MPQWAKIKFFYDSIPGSSGSLITATSATSTDPIENIYNTLETNRWMASDTTDPHYVKVDLNTGNPLKSADYAAIIGHNLNSAGASVSLECSADDFAADITVALAPFSPSSDKAVLKEFTQTPGKRYWRLKITGMTVPVYMAVCAWGLKTELDYASASFDPHGEERRANVNLSYGGYVAGVHAQWSERQMTLRFEDADEALYAKVRDWWERSGGKNFFVSWDSTMHPDDVFFMRPDLKLNSPLKNGGLYRDITLNLRGRKE